MAECSVEFCKSPSRGLGFCNTHYKRFKKFGSPFKTKSTPKGDAQKFYRDVVLTYEGDACLIWPYTRNDGYGALKRDGQMGLVSRFICEDLYGPPPEPDWQASHYCGRGADGYVTKKHMRWASRSENQMDTVIHGTHRRGERNAHAKLTQNQVKYVLSMRGEKSMAALGRELAVSTTTIYCIMKGKRWTWLSEAKP